MCTSTTHACHTQAGRAVDSNQLAEESNSEGEDSDEDGDDLDDVSVTKLKTAKSTRAHMHICTLHCQTNTHKHTQTHKHTHTHIRTPKRARTRKLYSLVR